MKNLYSEKDITVSFRDNELMVNGPLTHETVSAAFDLCQSLIPSQQSTVVNFSGVNACDSASLAFVAALMREGLVKQTSLQISHLPKEMLQLATVSGLNGFLPLADK